MEEQRRREETEKRIADREAQAAAENAHFKAELREEHSLEPKSVERPIGKLPHLQQAGSTPTAPPPPPAALSPASSVQSKSSGRNEDRNALLSSISTFNAGRLRSVQTNDRSVPQVSGGGGKDSVAHSGRRAIHFE